MRRDNKIDPRESKIIARQRYTERQIDKWVKWSWETLGKVPYKKLVKQQDKFKIQCYGWRKPKKNVVF